MELTFIYTIFILSILLHIVAGIIVVAFIIPLQLEQAGVKNGLVKLRKQMLVKGFFSLTVIAASVLVLTTRWYLPADVIVSKYFIVSLVSIHAIAVLGKAIIDFKIYHTQYSPASKDMHERIANLEKGDVKREANKARAAHKKIA